MLRGEEEQRSLAVLREVQPKVRDRLTVDCQRRPAAVKERVRVPVRRRLRLGMRVRAVRLEEMLPLAMEEERRAAVLRVRAARRSMRVKEEMLAMEEERRAAVLRIRAARRGMRVKDERRVETKDRLLKQRPERREPMREVMTME